MKRKLLSLGLFTMGAAISANAQLLNETFDTEIPSTWTIVDVDGHTSSTGQSAFASFAWNSNVQDASSSSWYDNSGTGPTDDWLITPAIVVPASGNYVLEFFGSSHEANYLEEYEVLMSTATTATADFTTQILNVVNEPETGTNHVVNIPAGANGNTIYLAFHHISNDESMLHIDNVVVREVFPYDMAGTAITSPAAAVGLNNAPFTIEADFVNMGSTTITSCDISYSIDGGAPVTQTGVTVNVATGATLSHTFTTPWTPAAAGTYTVEAWCSNLNGNADGNTSDDVASLSVGVAANATTKLPLYEHFTSNTCGPCASFNPGFQTLLNNNNVNATNADVACIKYQMDWPAPGTDEAWNSHGDARRGYYGVTGIPSPWFEGAGAAANQAEIDNAGSAFVEITGTATYNTGTTTLDVDLDVNPLTNLGTKTMHIAVVENSYTNTSGTNGETVFHEVMREMLPNASGQSINLAGGSVNVTESSTYTVGSVTQGSFNVWQGMNNLTVVAFIQDDSNQEILQAAVFPVSEFTSIKEEEKNFSLNIYPNPTTEDALVVVDMKEANELSMQIMDITGSLVKAENLGVRNGKQTLNFNGAELEAGIYFVKIQVGSQVITKRITLTK